MLFKGELGIHYPLHIINRYSLRDLLNLTNNAIRGLKDFNLTTVWPNDNLEYRSLIVCLTSFATQTELKLGTAITVPYLRNPVDLASSFASISELMSGREMYIGVGAGARPILGAKVRQTTPSVFVREFLTCFRTLLSGGKVDVGSIPNLAKYFHLKARSYEIRFPVAGPISLCYGGYGTSPGKNGMQMAGELCDGVLIGTEMKNEEIMKEILAVIDQGRTNSELREPIKKFMIINSSISRDEKKARAHAKRFVSHMVAGTPDERLIQNGIDPVELGAVRDAYSRGEGPEVAYKLMPDEPIDKVVITGTPNQCIERIVSQFKFAEEHDYSQVIIGVPVGPDLEETIDIWSKEILPSI